MLRNNNIIMFFLIYVTLLAHHRQIAGRAGRASCIILRKGALGVINL